MSCNFYCKFRLFLRSLRRSQGAARPDPTPLPHIPKRTYQGPFYTRIDSRMRVELARKIASKDEDLTPAGAWLIVVLYDLVPRATNRRELSYADLAEASGLARSTVSTLIPILEKLGYFGIKRGTVSASSRAPNVYYLQGEYSATTLWTGKPVVFGEGDPSGIERPVHKSERPPSNSGIGVIQDSGGKDSNIRKQQKELKDNNATGESPPDPEAVPLSVRSFNIKGIDQLVQEFGPDRVDLVARAAAARDLRNPTGWIVSALRGAWDVDPPAEPAGSPSSWYANADQVPDGWTVGDPYKGVDLNQFVQT